MKILQYKYLRTNVLILPLLDTLTSKGIFGLLDNRHVFEHDSCILSVYGSYRRGQGPFYLYVPKNPFTSTL